ncbi:MAG TPA: nucleoside-diphosphate sugar epimerase/dehydratase [Eoetvoesiella sp.]
MMDISAPPRKPPQRASGQADTKNLRLRLLALPTGQKRMLQITIDIALIWLTLWLAFYLRLGDAAKIEPFTGHAWLFALAPAIALPLYVRFGLYRAVMRYVGSQALASIAYATTISTLLLAIIIELYGDSSTLIPHSVPVIYWMLSLLFIGGLRLAMRHYFSSTSHYLNTLPFIHAPVAGQRSQVRVAIYGAGAAGNQLLTALRIGQGMLPVAFIDDNPALAGRVMNGLTVYATKDMDRLLRETQIQEVLLAIPSVSRCRRNEIINALAPYPLYVRTVPGFMDLASGRVQVQDLREVDVTDLLGRDPVQPHPDLFERCIREQIVMVTGAGGSIGAELCRQIVRIGPTTLVLFEQSEFNLYSIQQELDAYVCENVLNIRIIPILGSVRDHERLFNAMTALKVNTVYHAAAYKHVPMVERNIAEGVINNVFGTLNSAQAAMQAGVNNFVLISTDKAVRPSNIMGSTKRLAELVLQALATESMPRLYGKHSDTSPVNRTRFTMVRFGNVLGSSGSVIPLFRDQIRSGGPVTVTHPDITRYFMTIPEAAQLVIQAGALGQGGDVFVLDMGEPVKIAELARKMIRLSGLSVRSVYDLDGDISIKFTGLRPGEKLYEELLIGDNVTATEHPKIMRANEKFISWETLKAALAELAVAIDTDNYLHVRELFYQLVDGYKPDEIMVDWIQQQKAINSNRSVIATHSMPSGVNTDFNAPVTSKDLADLGV